MTDPDAEPEAISPERQVQAWRRIPWPLRIGLYGIALLGLIGLIAWTQRETIARNLIGAELEKQGIAATYEIESIGTGQQVVRNLVIGDPRRPDATIRRLSIDVSGGLFGITIHSATADGLRAYGRLADGRVSFGSLDRLIYTDSKAPFSLPRFDLTLTDARARIDTQYGALGLRVDGSGNLRGGFRGTLAAVGERLSNAGCVVDRPSVYGAISITGQRPQFDGLLRFDALSCNTAGLKVARSSVAVQAAANVALDRVSGALIPAAGAITGEGFAAAGLRGKAQFAATMQQIDGVLDLTLAGPAAAGIGFDQAALEGKAVLRMTAQQPDWSFEGDVRARKLSFARARLAVLDDLVASSANLPIGPLFERLATALRRALPGSDLAVQIQARGGGDGGGLALAVPRLSLTGARGDRLVGGNNLALRRDGDAFQIAGNVATGGQGLPQAALRIVPRGNGAYALRLTMDEYAADGASLALPELAAIWDGGDRVSFTGQARLSGPLPGGSVRGLALPLQGRWNRAAGLVMYDGCQTLRFDRLQFSNLTADRQSIRLCPQRGRPMVQQGRNGMQLAASLPGTTRLQGRLGSAALQVTASGMVLNYPGTAQLTGVDLLIGTAQSGTHLTAADFSVDLGGRLGGRFADAEATIGVVPLLLTRGSGTWSFADSVLNVAGDEWLLRDRRVPARFQPMVSTDMRLTLADNRIAVTGTLDEPLTGRDVVRVAIAHDLRGVAGHADLFVDGITFDEQLQPEMVSNIALGIIANTRGSLAGTGRIDWTANGVTSSTGRFRSDSLNFAAAFGPVTGLSGEIVFSDLLGLTTGPGQVVRLAQVNPGFAVNGGTIRYQLLPDFRMQVEGGEWPFAGGRLLLDPAVIELVSEAPRNLVFRVDRIDAAQFLAGFDFKNINATGIFTGIIPIVFDKDGGHVRGGRLEVIGDGGTLAYVGELTYEDLGTMANFAFNALRSLRYKYLIIELDGDLAGEVVTRIRFDGLSQGEGASRNFLTRQVEKLPLQFNVTISAPFLQLITSARSLYDTQYITDPAVLGLLPGQANNPDTDLPKTTGAEPGIQPPESEDRP